mmetsp:Transcript_34414/g.73295  ORF Transcript_34414/g.73295 Transcript_34414/m.73295 type:complete len:100 (+) Transcript_34414:598-897(+)
MAMMRGAGGNFYREGRQHDGDNKDDDNNDDDEKDSNSKNDKEEEEDNYSHIGSQSIRGDGEGDANNGNEDNLNFFVEGKIMRMMIVTRKRIARARAKKR